MTQRECPPHKPSGARCLVAHSDHDGNPKKQCFRCAYCHHWIHDGTYEDDCRDCKEQDNMEAGLCPNGHQPTEHPRPGWKQCVPCKIEWGDGVVSRPLG